MTRGVAAGAVYLPEARLTTEAIVEAWGTSAARGIERKTVPAADEDAVTMAVAAGERVLAGADVSRDEVAHLAFATTSPPLAEEEQTPRLARALGLSDDVETWSSVQSTGAAGACLAAGLDATGPALVVVADLPEGELSGTDHASGAAAAAFLLDDGAAVAIRDTATYALEAPGLRYRRRGSSTVESLETTTYEREAMASCVAGAVDRLDVDRDGLVGAALPQPDGATPSRLAGALDLPAGPVERGTVVDRIGDAGAATVAVGLLAALDGVDDGQTLAVFFGSGGSSRAFLLEGGTDTDVASALDGGTEIPYTRYLRQRGYVVDGEVAGGGANVSVPTWQRTLDQRYRLVAGRCSACGGLVFPPEGACHHCHERAEYDPVELPRRGTVRAHTTIGQGGAPPEFNEFQERAGAFGNALVEHRVGTDTVTVPGQLTDTDPETVTVGDEVVATLRRLYVQEGLPRYGLKYVPTD
jgi:hypothetical protein